MISWLPVRLFLKSNLLLIIKLGPFIFRIVIEDDITVNKENIPKSLTERFFVVSGKDKNCNIKNTKLGISK